MLRGRYYYPRSCKKPRLIKDKWSSQGLRAEQCRDMDSWVVGCYAGSSYGSNSIFLCAVVQSLESLENLNLTSWAWLMLFQILLQILSSESIFFYQLKTHLRPGEILHIKPGKVASVCNPSEMGGRESPKACGPTHLKCNGRPQRPCLK